MSERPRRTRMSAADRRESILDAATRVFADTGYRAGKTAAVARLVGVSEPVVFQNFGTKSALFAAVVERTADQVCAQLAHLTASPVPVPGLLRALLAPGHLADFHGAGHPGAIFADAATITDEPAVESAARAAAQRFAATLAGLLRRGQDDGDLRTTLDAEAAAWWLLSLVASQRYRQATAEHPDDIEARLADTTLEYLVGPR